MVVVGGGVFGVSGAIGLRRRGFRVTLVDPGPLPRTEAASTDISKIVRMDYGTDGLLTAWMEEALPIWRDWNARFGEALFHEDGFLVLSRGPLAPGGFEHDSLQTLTARGHALERLDGGTVGRRFPAWSGERYPDGYFNKAAGWAESGRVVAWMVDEARRAGVLIREGERFGEWNFAGGRAGGIVTAGGERLEAEAVLLAAGAWTPILAPWLQEWMRPVAQPVFWLKPADPAPFRPPRFTVWAAAIAETGWYGFPANRDGIVKVANHGPGRPVDPDAPRLVEPGEETNLRAFLRDDLPSLADAPLAASKTCLYCDTFDGDFWIGEDPDRPGLFVAAGDSGHGFKFAPVLGALIADVIEGKTSPLSKRFAWRSPQQRYIEQARFMGGSDIIST